MNSTVIVMLLQLMQGLIASAGLSSGTITTILNTLIALVPILIKEAKDVLPAVKNIIAALSDNPATTAEQLAILKALDAQVDAEYNDAVEDYLKNHPED